MPREYFAQFTWKKECGKEKNKGIEFWETVYTSSD